MGVKRGDAMPPVTPATLKGARSGARRGWGGPKPLAPSLRRNRRIQVGFTEEETRVLDEIGSEWKQPAARVVWAVVRDWLAASQGWPPELGSVGESAAALLLKRSRERAAEARAHDPVGEG